MSLTHPTCTPRPALATRHNTKTVFGHAVRILLAYTAGISPIALSPEHRAGFPRGKPWPQPLSARPRRTTPAHGQTCLHAASLQMLRALSKGHAAPLGPRQGRATSVARRRVSARKLRAKTAEPSLICASPGHAVDDQQTELHDKPAGCSTPRHMNHQAHGQAEFTVDANQERSAICSLLLLPACVSVLRQLVAAFFLHLNISTY